MLKKLTSKWVVGACLATLVLLGVVLCIVLLRSSKEDVNDVSGTDAATERLGRKAQQGRADTSQSSLAVTDSRVTNTVRVKGLTPADIAALGSGKYILAKKHSYFLADDEATKATRELDSLLDDDKNDDALKEAMRLRTHPDADVRSKVAFALKWLGLEGLEGLTSMLNDPDPDVAEEVNGFWKDALNEIENDFDKTSLLVSAAQVYGKDVPVDVLEDIVTELQMLDDLNAISGLTALFKGVSDPEREAVIGGAINAMADEDKPDLSKEQRFVQAEAIARELQESESQEPPSKDGTASSTMPLNIKKPPKQPVKSTKK